MKYVVPIIKDGTCDCAWSEREDNIRIHLDEFGVTDIICDLHGNWVQTSKLEFDSLEEYEAWRDTQ